MGRKPTISREGLLDVATEILRNDGARALTIDALAKAAGISKGGVQYSFSSKDDLIRALVSRWTEQIDALLELDQQTDPVALVRRYIHTMRASENAMDSKMAGLLIAFYQDHQNLLDTRAWYISVLAKLEGDSPGARAARIAFLAVEGLLMLRAVGVEPPWNQRLDEIEASLP
ncbi:TetR/AcrR family transcriptional regulator [Ketogulonicigenium vulgare]|uniref:Transcriptional regulator, TetR family protein n=1 Tax=Ketogulonicigenium vulgare (strain WSH-001) TaxID=759362 RepID=F9Y603_KETVW|nr:TetR/AcrR family transcriptional regulator [Ketogulonicigenium vulgare]ADO42636.1 transcriptional regulator, TetR family [Ketogulonicigenium vulgare Y25]AEM40828.1 Transcriptional regulator, TetR family protein [Ketogulonicigenium vulgare WSH-001]ALJ80993.1 TetR family transcriptional regulator [Ketogulonicigenium vulgare]ANW33758.1 TetR family transcriptional regulator [Ketogulonicigenium vulgare]AOZ54546.1 transcriptional regulator, TetR family [Ketogulonicigenium vulgare]